MSYYHGKQPRGAARTRREILRAEAETRNANTEETRRKAYRLGPVHPDTQRRTARSIAAYQAAQQADQPEEGTPYGA